MAHWAPGRLIRGRLQTWPPVHVWVHDDMHRSYVRSDRGGVLGEAKERRGTQA